MRGRPVFNKEEEEKRQLKKLQQKSYPTVTGVGQLNLIVNKMGPKVFQE